MAKPDGRIEKGQRIASAISARAWNRAQDAADIVLGVRPGVTAGESATSSAPYTWVYAKNNQTFPVRTIPLWGVVAIDGLEIEPESETDAFFAIPVVRGVTPESGVDRPFGIALEPIPPDGVGKIAVDGVVQTKIDVLNASDATAGAFNTVDYLRSGGRGASIIWKEQGTGANKRALVKLGGDNVRLGKIYVSCFKEQTANVVEINGDGSARTANPTFTAFNHFADVLATNQTPAKVACILIDSTWCIIAAECL